MDQNLFITYFHFKQMVLLFNTEGKMLHGDPIITAHLLTRLTFFLSLVLDLRVLQILIDAHTAFAYRAHTYDSHNR